MNSTRLIPLSGGKAHAIVDAEAFEFLSLWNWSVTDKGYARRVMCIDGASSLIWMHRFIMSPPPGIDVDHINRNPLDNRLCNLRYATKTGNVRNRGPNKYRRHGVAYKGVYKNANCLTYTARISRSVDGVQKHIYLGSFRDQIDAARAYDAAALEIFGEFAALNFPIEKAET